MGVAHLAAVEFELRQALLHDDGASAAPTMEASAVTTRENVPNKRSVPIQIYAQAFGRYVCSARNATAIIMTAQKTVNSNKNVEANAPGASTFRPCCTYRIRSTDPTATITTEA